MIREEASKVIDEIERRYITLYPDERKAERLLQCISCQQDHAICGCDENNEDENGLCKNYIGETGIFQKESEI